MEVINALGRRKRAIARVFVTEGTGKITINKRDLTVYFPSSLLQYVVLQPLKKLDVAEMVKFMKESKKASSTACPSSL